MNINMERVFFWALVISLILVAGVCVYRILEHSALS